MKLCIPDIITTLTFCLLYSFLPCTLCTLYFISFLAMQTWFTLPGAAYFKF